MRRRAMRWPSAILAARGRAMSRLRSTRSTSTATAPLCLLGGLAPLYAPRLSARYQAMLKPPLQDALGGAVSMAVRMFGKAEAAHG